MKAKPKLLLHICCAPCSTYPIKALQEEYDVELFFYNPNIHPEGEYNVRLEEARKYAGKIGVKFYEADYDTNVWFNCTQGLEEEPEGGARCEICCRIRLGRTAHFALANGIKNFTTTLSISPHKSTAMINNVGQVTGKIYSLDFYEADFKKKDGFKIAAKLAKDAGLYRQNYCGCIYSKKEHYP